MISTSYFQALSVSARLEAPGGAAGRDVAIPHVMTQINNMFSVSEREVRRARYVVELGMFTTLH
jgi:hypothetical protein